MPEASDNFLPPPPALPEPSLFDSPSIAAGRVAARYAKTRYRQILQHLKDNGPSCIFEIAAALSTEQRQVFDHAISGRFGALEKDLLITRTGHTKVKPDTGCKCSLYQITLTGLASLAAGDKGTLPLPEMSSGDESALDVFRRITSRSSNPVQTPVEGGSQ